MRGGTRITSHHLYGQEISIHPPHAGRDILIYTFKRSVSIFQSTRPVRGGTGVFPPVVTDGRNNFNPPAPCGAGPEPPGKSQKSLYFNPPAPCGAGRVVRICGSIRCLFQSTRPVRGGTAGSINVRQLKSISIHPPRAGRDQNNAGYARKRGNFNPPAPCGAGHNGIVLVHQQNDFNPPAPCGAGRANARAAYGGVVFQSTRPVRGGTRSFCGMM